MSTELLSIGAFAHRARLSPKALRLYERLELLAPAEVDSGTGYRRYREEQLPAARLVVLLRRLDMPLAEIRELVGAPRERIAEQLQRYWAAAETRHASQRELVAHLLAQLADEGSSAMFDDVRERDVPEQLVLTEQRHVPIDELSTWLDQTIGRLAATAEHNGGVAAPVFVVYHGEVNHDSDGPVEVCVPVSRDVDGRATRVEPAHREAYVRLRKAQVEFPQILSAYDAVAGWVKTNGKAIACPPREVYFNDFVAAGPEDEVCDVAFPVES
ncbi:MAG TPA: MerR family transcriptional regulator [Gaiellaceae bacterium]